MANTLKVTVTLDNGKEVKTFQLTEAKPTKTWLKFLPAPDCKDIAPFSPIYVAKPADTKAKGKKKAKKAS